MIEKHYSKLVWVFLISTTIFATLYIGTNAELSIAKRTNDVLWEVCDELSATLALTRELNLDIAQLERVSPQVYAVALTNGTLLTAKKHIVDASTHWIIIPMEDSR